MGKEATKSLLDELSSCKDYDIALMTSFNFEIDYFERAILNKLYACELRKISLFVDSKEFNKAIKDVSSCLLGKKYIVTPVEMNGSFHPKVILLLGERKAKLIVGSANIKASGFAINNEIYNVITYSSSNPEYLDVINGAIDFFDAINSQTIGLDTALINEAKDRIYYHKTTGNGERFLLHNLKKSILAQTREVIQEEIKEVSIAVPYYDKKLVALSCIKEEFNNPEVKVYIQNSKSTFPIDYNAESTMASNVIPFLGFLNLKESCRNNFYHGKVFLFQGAEKDYVLYGSANCTQSALTKTNVQGGNVECDLLEIGDKGEFDYFFDNINVDTGKKIESNIMTFDNDSEGNYFFRYGKLEDEIVLHIGYIRKNNIKSVKLHDLELLYSFTNNELVVRMPEDYTNMITDIFEIEIYSESSKEYVRCWYYNEKELEYYRFKQTDKELSIDFENDSDGDKFVADRMALLNAERTCLPELIEYKKVISINKQIDLELEGDDIDAGDADYVDDVPLTDEYRATYRHYNKVASIRKMFITNYLKQETSLALSIFGKDILRSSYNSNVEEEPVKIPRKPTSFERRFERFVKGKVKGIINDNYVEIIEPEHYYGVMTVILGIFKKYKKEELVEDIFPFEYVGDTRTLLYIKLLSKDLSVIKSFDNFETEIIIQCFTVIIDNYLYAQEHFDSEKRQKIESINRKLLITLNDKYSLRDSYAAYINDAIVKGENSISALGIEGVVHYIESLFGYKSYNKLLELITQKYPSANVEFNGRIVRIVVDTEVIKEHYRPNVEVLSELVKYSRIVAKIDSVKIIVNNISDNPLKKNITVKIEHDIDMFYRKWNKTETRLDKSKTRTSQTITLGGN